MEPIHIATHSPNWKMDENNHRTIEDRITCLVYYSGKFIWDRLITFSYNTETPIELSNIIEYLQSVSEEKDFPGLDESQRNEVIFDGVHSYFQEEATFINQRMKYVYSQLCDSIGLKDPLPLEEWTIIQNESQYHYIQAHFSDRLRFDPTDWSFEVQLSELIDVVADVSDEMRSYRTSDPDSPGFDFEEILELAILKIYVINPELVRNYEKVIKLVLRKILNRVV